MKGQVNTDDRTKLVNAHKMYTSPKSHILLRETAPDDVKCAVEALQELCKACNHEITVTTIPHVKQFIVVPILSDAQMRDEHLWRHTFGTYTPRGVQSGRNLVLWLDKEGIQCAPITMKDQSRLLKMLYDN